MKEEKTTPLLQRMIEDMRIRGMGESAQRAHIRAIKEFAAFLGRSPDTAPPEDLRAYQLHMTTAGITPSTFNARIVALRFFFGMTCGREEMKRYMQFRTQPRRLPVVFSVEEVSELLIAAPGPGLKYRAALSISYGAGLRSAEVCNHKIGDIDSDRMLTYVEQGKGKYDHKVMLWPVYRGAPSCRLVSRGYMDWHQSLQKQWEKDLTTGTEEASMRFWIAIGLILVLSAVGLTYEIAAGRVLAPFFGTSLVTWTAVIATVLAGFSLGSGLGGLAAERERHVAVRNVRLALIATAVLMALSPTVLGLLYAWGARGTGGMLLTVFVAFFPASVLVSFPSPFLARLAVEARPGREGSSLGLVLAAGSLGAIMGAILAGFVTLPLIGSAATFAGCGAAALLCVPFVRGGASGAGGEAEPRITRETERGLVEMFAAAALVVAASMAGGPACRYESGLSCIDVDRVGGAVYLYSDRTRQAAERNPQDHGQPGSSSELVLPYTQWIWARMDRDLGPSPSVLFVGGGGYTLPTKLLESRPAARAVAVEIDPLVTQVVRRHMPWAGAMIEQTGYDASRGAPQEEAHEGRLGIVHADGRVYLNETERRFGAAVVDAFSSGSVPAHLVTLETYERLQTVVEGPVYVNLIDAPDGPLARGVFSILNDLYPHIEAVQGEVSIRGRTNIVIAASRSPFARLDALPEGYETTSITPGRAFTDDRGWVGHR